MTRAITRTQRGSTLIISLIVLLILTIIGVAGMQSTNTQERIASNVRESNLAFQAAEAALRRGEQFVEQIVSTGGFDGSGGLYGSSDAIPDYWDPATWSAGNSMSYTDAIASVSTPDAIADVAEQPRFIIQHVTTQPMDQGALNIRNYGHQRIGDVGDFRITARGVGGDSNAVVILQTYYGKRL